MATESDLCTSCALCCNGALHNFTFVDNNEVEPVERLGLSLSARGERQGFDQPCTKLRECRCTVYESRPKSCQRYRCRLLNAVSSGALKQKEAHLIISRVRSLLSQIEPLLPADDRPLWPKAMAFVEQINALPDPAEARRQNANTLKLIAALAVVGKSRFLPNKAVD